VRLRFLTWLLVVVCATAGPASAACTGDCNADGVVTINELISGVNISLDRTDLAVCRACDRDGDGAVTIAELVAAVRATLDGCPATPTPSPSQSLPTWTPTQALPTATATRLSCEVAGVICTVAGTGNAQYDGDGRDALDTSLYFPIDLIFDRDGRPLILDWNNLLLRRINGDGTIESIMGIPFTEDFPVDGAPAKDTSLHHASDIEFDSQGRLYVAGDHVPVVFRVGLDDRVFTVAGTEEFGYAGDGRPALQALMSTPFGVLPDMVGGFYVSDVDAHVVRYVDADGIIDTVAGTGVRGYSGDHGPGKAAQLAGPSRLKIGPDGNLYFCETRNHVIRRLHPDGTIDTFAGTGARGYSGDHGPAAQAQFDTPYDVRFAPSGDAYVADTGNNVIRRIDSNGVVTTVVGDGAPAFAGDGGPAADSSLRRPSAVIFDTDGSLWIADTSNQRVRRVWHFLDTQ
jgi:hypothetical protein